MSKIIQQKYIRTENDEIIIFPMSIEHSRFINFKPISAGFCVVEESHVSCLGESFSLNLKSNEKEDSEIATLQLFGLDAVLEFISKT